MKIKDILLILSLFLIYYLGKTRKEGYKNEKDELRYGKHRERQKKCLMKILNKHKPKPSKQRNEPHRNSQHYSRHNTDNNDSCGCKSDHNSDNNSCGCKSHHNTDNNPSCGCKKERYFNKSNYTLKTSMFPMAKTITPNINVKIVKKNKKCHRDKNHHKHRHSFDMLNELIHPFEQPSSNLLPHDQTPQTQRQLSPKQPYSDTQQPAIVLPTLSSFANF